MFFCLRVDLDYVPWDTPDAATFGHGEPASFLRLLQLCRETGFKLHFFVSNRALRAFPAVSGSVLDDGHDLDWLCKHPQQSTARWEAAEPLFEALGHRVIGLAARDDWPSGTTPPWPECRFISAKGGDPDLKTKLFLVRTKTDREAYHANIPVRLWTDQIKQLMRDAASRQKDLTVVVRPQVIARYDRSLEHIRELLTFSQAIGLPVMTLRSQISLPGA